MDDIERAVAKYKCEKDHLFFTRFFFKKRHGIKFIVNWHHEYLGELVDRVFDGTIENLVINIAPGSSKTEEVVINLMARGLAKNPRSRFLHLSYSDDVASGNSQAARETVTSDEFQAMWPLRLSSDTKAKKRWNIMLDGKKAGGVYATSIGGQVTGFRAGHMAEGFLGSIILDDPLKPEDAFSKTKVEQANRKLLTTVKSRKANPRTPIIIIMQRIAELDPTGFIEKGGIPGKWTIVKIPALLDDNAINELPEKYRERARASVKDDQGRVSYWEYKEPVADLNEMEKGRGEDQSGNRISSHVFSSQYQQQPIRMGGNIIKGKYFKRYSILPQLKYREIYADTAQKTAERNDFSVFQVWGCGMDNKAYLIDQIRGKWEAPDLERQAKDFWNKHHNIEAWDINMFGMLRQLLVEDKSSGTGLVQSIRDKGGIPVVGIERDKDKYTRVMDALPYMENGEVFIPEEMPWISDYVSEHEAFTADGTHAHDDQVDPTVDAINHILGPLNKLKIWERVADAQTNDKNIRGQGSSLAENYRRLR